MGDLRVGSRFANVAPFDTTEGARAIAPAAEAAGIESHHRMNATVDRLSQINVPTLVIHGDRDRLVPFGNGQHIAAHINGARLSMYAGVGHLPPIEATERLNREVVDFLGEGR